MRGSLAKALRRHTRRVSGAEPRQLKEYEAQPTTIRRKQFPIPGAKSFSFKKMKFVQKVVQVTTATMQLKRRTPRAYYQHLKTLGLNTGDLLR